MWNNSKPHHFYPQRYQLPPAAIIIKIYCIGGTVFVAMETDMEVVKRTKMG